MGTDLTLTHDMMLVLGLVVFTISMFMFERIRADATALVVFQTAVLATVQGGVVSAPTLVLLGVQPLVAHFFVFYYGVLADITRDGGFPPLMLDPIDFASAYVAQMDSQQQAQGQPGGDGEPPVGHA